MRTIIAGSRGIINPFVAIPAIESAPWTPSVVLCGMCRGVDMIGRRWARENGIQVEEYPADWDTYGKSAGSRRNRIMAQKGDGLILVRYVSSRGSANMLREAASMGLRLHDVVVSEGPPLPEGVGWW